MSPPKQCFENISSWVYFLSFTACRQLNVMRYDIVHKIDFKVVTGKKFAKTLTIDFYWYSYSHKKQKDSLETQAELSVVSTYVENQAILERIFLYRGSKCKQTKERAVYDPYYYLFIRLLPSFFLFSVKIQTKQDGCNLSKKH